MQVQQFIENSAERYPRKTALICGTDRVTYREIDSLADRLANDLIRRGVRRGDRVAVYMDNCVDAVVSIFGILKADAVFLVVNPTTKADKLAYVLNNCEAAAIVTDKPRTSVVAQCRAVTASVRHVWVSGGTDTDDGVTALGTVFTQPDRSRPPCKGIDIDLAALIYTSGSTGQPKGVTLTHLNIVSAATSITTYLGNTPDDIILSVLPLAFDYGLYQMLMAFRCGATLVLERSFTYPHAVLTTIMRERVTGFPIVPTIAAILLQLDLSAYDLSCLRYVTNTAAALPGAHIAKLRELLPSAQIFSMYGLTECKRVSYLPPDQIDIRPGSIGRGMPNEEVYIVDDDGERVPPGIVGELVVRGSNVMKGYWNAPAETDKRLRPGPFPWEKVLYTGDLFRADEEGYLYFVGRRDDIIKSRGEKVSPREVEEVLHRFDGIAEAVVIGVPDAVLGSAIKAVVSLREGAGITPEEIRRHCARHLEDFMVPKYVEILPGLPKSDNGKIDRKEVAAVCAV